MKEAQFYKKTRDNKVQCTLCSHECIISHSERGTCGVRENLDGILYALNHGKLAAQHIDPIEKKPLFHFYPGSKSYSISTVGCNFRCSFCQNYDLSQMPVSTKKIIGHYVSPEKVVDSAAKYNCKSISYTYTEPTIYFEYALDVARIAHERNIKNVFVTNGYFTPEALKEIAPYLNAVNVDLKSFSEDFYKKLSSAKLQPVLDSIKLLKDYGIWIEVTTLLMPSKNDSDKEIYSIAEFISSIDVDIPWHISAFYPTYKLLNVPPTSPEKLLQAREIGINTGLHYVYTGNIYNHKTESTYCYGCKKQLIERNMYEINNNLDSNANCPYCRKSVAGIGLVPSELLH
jgi:pyruvate formate lyase activating enzyme